MKFDEYGRKKREEDKIIKYIKIEAPDFKTQKINSTVKGSILVEVLYYLTVLPKNKMKTQMIFMY